MRPPFALRLSLLVAPLAVGGCSVAPPVSQFPNAQAAIDRMRAGQSCASGLHATASIDRFGDGGRLRGELLLFAVRPALLRLDVVSPFGAALLTLTSDGHDFGLADLRNHQMLRGPASTCNISRLTSVPVPGRALVDLLRGEAPVLRHDAAGATLEWSPRGYYVVRIKSTRDAEEEIHLAPRARDFAKPWGEQRLRVLDVLVRQRGVLVYHADLDDHAVLPTATALIDKDGIDPPVPPSGPPCDAETPRALHVEVPARGEDVRIRYVNAEWNPPLPSGTFTQPTSPGFTPNESYCDDEAPGGR